MPSARGYGDPLTGYVTPPSGASFLAVLLGHDKDVYLMASDAGYGFMISLHDMYARNKAGKAVLKLSNNAQMLMPQRIQSLSTDFVAIMSNEGRFLIFSAKELPELAKGKGNKMISIPAKRAEDREEWVTNIVVFPKGACLELFAGKRKLVLKPHDLEHYLGERGRRGNKLPKGFQRIDNIKVI